MNADALDIAAYLRRIGFTGPLVATAPVLARIVARHAEAIPFENIEVLAGRVPGLGLAALQRKLVLGGRGGYCFEQNGLLLAVLRMAGFAVRPREARVRLGVPDGVATGRTHMALEVALPDAPRCLVDVGFGGAAPAVPLVLSDRGVQHDGVDAFRLLDDGTDRVLQVETEAGWTDCYRLAATEPQPIDFEIGNWWVATHPQALLRNNLLVARALPGLRLTLFNDLLTQRRPGGTPPQQRRLATRAEFEDVLAEGFGLRLAAADVDAVLATVGRRAGADGGANG